MLSEIMPSDLVDRVLSYFVLREHCALAPVSRYIHKSTIRRVKLAREVVCPLSWEESTRERFLDGTLSR
jgi:hypothetical protein